MGITLHLNTDFQGDAKALGYDMALDCRGYKFSGPQKYMQGDMARHVSEKSGQIVVNEFCQVEGNIFSFGDVCLTPSQEPKTIVSMYQYKDIVAHNILAHLVG